MPHYTKNTQITIVEDNLQPNKRYDVRFEFDRQDGSEVTEGGGTCNTGPTGVGVTVLWTHQVDPNSEGGVIHTYAAEQGSWDAIPGTEMDIPLP